MWVGMEASSKRTCTRKQVGEHQIVGFCGEHISDTMKDGHPRLFKEGPEGSLLPMVPVKDVCAPVIGIPHKKLILNFFYCRCHTLSRTHVKGGRCPVGRLFAPNGS